MNFKVKIPIDLMSGKNLHRRVAEDRGGSQDCQATMGQERLRGATPRPRSGAAAGRSYPMSKELWLRGHRKAERSYSTFKVRRGSCEE